MNSKICTFIGHKDCPQSIYETIYKQIKSLIVEENVRIFYVGCNGSFDFYVRKSLEKLSKEYKSIKYYIVISYLSDVKRVQNTINTIYPDGIETIPQKFAISWRNKWMIKKSDFLICYITHNLCNASKFYEYAKKKNKTIINIAETTE